MKILDRYLIKQFLLTGFFALLSFTVIFVLIDLMEKLGNFIDQQVPFQVIVEYYIYFIPEIVRLMIPVAVLLSSLFTAGKMSSFSELTAITASGVSIYRFMAPFLAVTLVISFASIFFGGYLVPHANKYKVHIERTYMKKDPLTAGSNIIFQDSKTRIVGISYYDVINEKANQISIQDFQSDDLTQMTGRIDAANMKYDSSAGSWILSNTVIRKFSPEGEEQLDRQASYILDGLNFKPGDLISRQQKSEELSLSELATLAKMQQNSGIDPTRILIEYNSRISFSFAALIVVFFGLPISANKRRGGLALQFGLNLLIAFIYLGFTKISQALGKNGQVDPLFTAWISNIIFLLAGFLNLYRVPK